MVILFFLFGSNLDFFPFDIMLHSLIQPICLVIHRIIVLYITNMVYYCYLVDSSTTF